MSISVKQVHSNGATALLSIIRARDGWTVNLGSLPIYSAQTWFEAFMYWNYVKSFPNSMPL